MKKILVVDNHPVMLKFMQNLLEKKGHEVRTAPDGLSALDVLKQYVPDVIFTDLIMPNIDGEKLCQVVRGMPELDNVYLIVLSSIAGDSDINVAKLGAHAGIAKGPFDKMSQHVLEVLDRLDQDITKDTQGRLIGHEVEAFAHEVAKELLSSKRHMEIILKNISEGVLELSPEGQIIYANSFGLYLTGKREVGLLGTFFPDLFAEPDRSTIREVLGKMGSLPRAISKDPPLRLNNKEVSVNILPVAEKDSRSFIVILNNISELVRLKAQLKDARSGSGG